MPRWETNGVFFAPIRLHSRLKKSKRTVGSPARTTKARLRGQRETGCPLKTEYSFFRYIPVWSSLRLHAMKPIGAIAVSQKQMPDCNRQRC